MFAIGVISPGGTPVTACDDRRLMCSRPGFSVNGQNSDAGQGREHAEIVAGQGRVREVDLKLPECVQRDQLTSEYCLSA